jgi:NAD(P)-dependent dehydrogenase (short-subunit alcohol dehydrogenase family)
MAKAGLDNMVRSLCVELREFNIRINAVSPGLVATEMSAPMIEGNPNLNDKNTGKPENIAAVMALVASPDGSFMNGEVYTVHGGFPYL